MVPDAVTIDTTFREGQHRSPSKNDEIETPEWVRLLGQFLVVEEELRCFLDSAAILDDKSAMQGGGTGQNF